MIPPNLENQTRTNGPKLAKYFLRHELDAAVPCLTLRTLKLSNANDPE